ncbi:ABC transporter ATP-binding protein [Kordiimonas sp.]|uniref:ABC transporter ATP-binding protein n=1 Tax=Kordiimonas sp. TaxID=1970157 RepID=UPI003A90AC9A
MKDTLCFEVEGLTKEYGEGHSKVRALRGVNLTIRDGEIIVLLGPSGSGKSTLLNILGGLDSPTDGHVRFHGIDLGTMSERALTNYRRNNIGFIFQNYNLMPGLTAEENVELVTEIAVNPLPAAEALDLVGLKERTHHFPSQLSGGEQQRVAIARAIAKRPSVLFCDEPTGALDSTTSLKVLNALDTAAAEMDTTMLMVTHHQGIAPLADRVLHFRDGNIEKEIRNESRAKPEEIEL